MRCCPIVYQGAVEHYGWLTGSQMIDGLALGDTTPGPLIMVVAFVGFIGASTQEVFGPICRCSRVSRGRCGHLFHLPAIVPVHPLRRPTGRGDPRRL
jgi:chromate transporter